MIEKIIPHVSFRTKIAVKILSFALKIIDSELEKHGYAIGYIVVPTTDEGDGEQETRH